MTEDASGFDIGRRLEGARLRCGLNQSELARQAKVAPSYLSRVENGKVQPTFRTVLHLVNVMGVDFAAVVGPAPARVNTRGACPITSKGQCLLDRARPVRNSDRDRYSPRELRLLRRFAAWVAVAPGDRLRAMEVLLEDLALAAGEEQEDD
jgi:transcriptional regulator with XRE-family HTH domain